MVKYDGADLSWSTARCNSGAGTSRGTPGLRRVGAGSRASTNIFQTVPSEMLPLQNPGAKGNCIRP